MNLRTKLLVAFLVVIAVFAIMGGVNYAQVNSVSNNVDDIVDKNAPAAEIIMDMRIDLGWMFAAHAELVEGADAYKSTISGGGSVDDANLAAEPAYINAMSAMEAHHETLEEAHDAFTALGYFTGEKAEEMNALIEKHDETIEYFKQLERDYRAADWEAGEETMELLDASAIAADEALEQVEEVIDADFVKLNEDTQDMTDQTKTLILVLLLVGIVIGIIIALFMANMIIAPVKKLTEAANAVSRGDKDLKAPEITSKDEIGELGESFGRMIASLKIMMMDED